MLFAEAIVELQDSLTREWHGTPGASTQGAAGGGAQRRDGESAQAEEMWLAAVERQHRANFDLWHIEDQARAPGASAEDLAGVKRRVDRTNQLRNDRTEELDRMLLARLEARNLPRAEAALHSESPGLMIDRLSILALKIYHTREEAEREDAPAGHAMRNRERLAILEEQRADLAACLDTLWSETLAGTRRFKLYRQLKMYNDPSLNPAIYGKSPGDPGV